MPGKPISKTTQRVIELAHGQPQLSSSVIAERTGISRSRVTQILHEAKRRAREKARRRASGME
jgi:DNA-directed RNA polymerase specialized sigma subunit